MKLVATTLTAGLLLGTVSVVPAGLTHHASASAFINPTFLTSMVQIHDVMTAPEKAAVNAARNSLNSLNSSDWDTLLGDVLNDLPLSDPNNKANFKALILAAVNTLYSPDGSGLETLRNNATYHDLLQNVIASPAGVPDLTVDNIVEFFVNAQTVLNSKLNSLTPAQLLNVVADPNYRNDVAVQVVQQLLAVNSPLTTVFKYYYESNDTTILTAFITRLLTVPNVSQASIAIFNAYVRVDGITGTNPGNGGGGNGGGGIGGVTSGGPTGPVTPTTGNTGISDAVKEIGTIAAQLKNATLAEKDKLLKDAVGKAQQALQSAGKIDLSKSVKTEGDKSVAQLVTDDVKKQIADIKKATEELNAKLKELGVATPLLKPSLTIDMGELKTASGEVNIPADILTEALNSGFDNATVIINGIAVTIPVAEFQKDTTLGVTTRDSSEASKATDKAVVSNVVDFNLTVDGKPVTTFETPIQIKIPVKVNGVDKELLAVAKLVDGKLVIVGGHLEGDVMVEFRDTFSSYVVVENKVSFNDIDHVKSWAGRQIQVVAAKGAIVGKSEGVFAPQDDVTRAEFARMLISALDLENRTATESFTDVNSSDWFAPYVAAAVKHGVIFGRTADKFEPSATITRAEMAAMITRALKATKNLDTNVVDADAALKAFSDAAEVNSSLKSSVAFAVSKGLLFGNEGKLDPNANATRAQAAVMLYRILNYTE